MQLQHDRERGEFNRQVEADQQEFDRRVAAAQAAFSRKAEAEKQALHRRMEAEQAGMLARHSQQEGEYWLRRKQKATKTLSPTLVAPQPIESKAQSTPSRPSAAPGCAPRKRPLPTPDPAGKQSLLQACDDQSEDEQQAMSARRAQQKARPQLKQLFVTPQPGKPGQPKSNVTSSRIKRVPKKEPEMIDLCSSDDNLLVEVTRTAYQNTTAATLQLFGESSQEQSVSHDQHSDNVLLLTTKVTASVGANQAREIWSCSVSSRSASAARFSTCPEQRQQANCVSARSDCCPIPCSGATNSAQQSTTPIRQRARDLWERLASAGARYKQAHSEPGSDRSAAAKAEWRLCQ
jgi:hypothetical protein